MTLKEVKQSNSVSLSDILLPKQKIAFELLEDGQTTEVLYGGAAGGGKSMIGNLWLANNCLLYPGTRWVMGRSVLKTLKETTLATFFEVSDAFRWGGLYKYKQQEGRILWNNGSEILLKDLFAYPSDPEFESLGSLEITGAFVDECSQITNKAKQILKSRIRYKLNEYGIIPKLLLTTNPSKNWVYTEFYKPYKDGDIPTTKAFVPALPGDNPYLPQSYIDSLNELDEPQKQRLLYGNFDYDDDPAALTTYDAQLDLFYNEHIEPNERDKYMTCDIAGRGSDKFRIGIWHGWALVEDFEYDKSTGKQVIDEIRAIKTEYNIPNSRIVYDADGVGGGVDGFFPGSHAFLNGARPFKGENYENLKTQCYYKLAEKINRREMFIYVGKTKDEIDFIVEELGQIKRRDMDKDGKLKILRKEEVKNNIGRSPDWSDMLMMRCYFDVRPAGISLGVVQSR